MERNDVSWDSQNRSKEKEKPLVHSLYIWLSLQIPETCGKKKKKKLIPYTVTAWDRMSSITSHLRDMGKRLQRCIQDKMHHLLLLDL